MRQRNGEMPHSAITRRTRGQARALRRAPTDAERKLWYLLRSLKPLGLHVRRQAPIGIYIADFAWHAGKLVVELDGSQHAQARADYDGTRSQWLESQDYRVLRFWNNDVLKLPRGVGETILAAARESGRIPTNPTPNPSPQGGGEPAAASGQRIIS
jgi:very-short-patch-repair endonuclease